MTKMRFCAAGNHVRVWLFTTDQGPDQVAASKLLQRDVEEVGQ